MRRRFTTSDVSTFRFNDHVAWSGDGPAALDRLATSLFSLASMQGAQLHFVADVPDPGRLAGLARIEELIEGGRLVVSSIEDTYRALPDTAVQRALLDEMLDAALEDGFSGLCVVADNSPLASGDDEQFADWLAWEAVADHLQASRPVTGVCYFDENLVSAERLAVIASAHPVLSSRFADPAFQVYTDGDAVRMVGEVDRLCCDQLYRILASAPRDAELVVDASEIAFIDHRGLMALDRIAGERRGLRLRGASPFVRRVWDLLDLAAPNLELG